MQIKKITSDDYYRTAYALDECSQCTHPEEKVTRYLHRGNRTIQNRMSTSETDDAQVIPMTVLASCAAPCACCSSRVVREEQEMEQSTYLQMWDRRLFKRHTLLE